MNSYYCSYCSYCNNYIDSSIYQNHLQECLMNNLLTYFSNSNIHNSNIYTNTYNFDLNNNNISDTFSNMFSDVTSFVNQNIENINQTQENQINNQYTIQDLNKKFPIMKCIEKTECIICFEDKIKLCRELNCNHIFCYECIDKWFLKSNSCPVCKKNII